MRRRDFLRSTAMLSAGLTLSKPSELFGQQPQLQEWRTFEITTRVELRQATGATRIWLPAALITDTPFQRTHANRFQAEGGVARQISRRVDALGIVAATFPKGATPRLTLVSLVSTRPYAVDLFAPTKAVAADRDVLEHCLLPTKLIPTSGIVKATADRITSGAKNDVAKARAIYDWIVDNTFRNPLTRGCGIGDIRFMLESGDLGGKCADLNALFVGLARASGLPARDAYGIRVAPSALGYKSLGANSETVTKSQHCRADVFLAEYGWVPVDPADVRKVVLEEPPGNRPLDDPMVAGARARLFGSWEMNWIAYNFAHDVSLPGSKGGPIGYLMYPQAETAEGRLDSLDPDAFKYEITAREIA